MFLTDTHCHISAEYYPDNLDVILQNAVNEDVKRLIFASVDVKTSYEAMERAKVQTNNPVVYALAGVHPHEAKDAEPGYLDEIKKLASNREMLAVGEIGLDYFYDITPRDEQRRVFREQIELALDLKKPVVLHIRDAAERSDGDATTETLDILKEMHAERIGGIVHCFSGQRADMERALEMGFYISFAGPVTFPRNQYLREIAIDVPMDRILCETDSPYLAPQGFRGKTNEPARVRKVYELIAMLKEQELDEFARRVHENVNTLFKLEEQYV